MAAIQQDLESLIGIEGALIRNSVMQRRPQFENSS